MSSTSSPMEYVIEGYVKTVSLPKNVITIEPTPNYSVELDGKRYCLFGEQKDETLTGNAIFRERIGEISFSEEKFGYVLALAKMNRVRVRFVVDSKDLADCLNDSKRLSVNRITIV